MTFDRTAALQKHLETASANLASLRQERDEAVMQLLDHPDNINLAATLDQLRIEIPQAEGRVVELQSALDLVLKSNGVEARKARRAKVKSLVEATVRACKKREALATKIGDAIDALAPLLAAWEQAGESIRQEVSEAMRMACPDLNLRMHHGAGSILAIADGTASGFQSSLVEHMAQAQIGVTGIRHPDHQMWQRMIGMRSGMSLPQANALNADRIARLLRKFEDLADKNIAKLDGTTIPPVPVKSFVENEVARHEAAARAGSSVEAR